jgi:hypothetical protein
LTICLPKYRRGIFNAMPAYNALLAREADVRIADEGLLRQFMRPQYAYHHPVQVGMIEHAGEVAKIAEVAYYHGGDPLYTLYLVPGLWHEACLHPIIT